MSERIDRDRKVSVGVDDCRCLSTSTDAYDTPFLRSEALLGEAAMRRLAAAHVLVVGVGGVGSWCAEALVRTGLGHITLVDDDTIVESNLNRQCPATTATIGRPKVEAMRERLLAINPKCAVEAVVERFECRRGVLAASEGLSIPLTDAARTPRLRFDLIVDAIDSVDCKAALILSATEAGVPIVSSMGAALRTDPTNVRVTRFEKVEGDGLAKALRQRFKKFRRFPAAKFPCVWSAEPAISHFHTSTLPKGSLMTVTATFGMCLASEAIRILTKGEQER